MLFFYNAENLISLLLKEYKNSLDNKVLIHTDCCPKAQILFLIVKISFFVKFLDTDMNVTYFKYCNLLLFLSLSDFP